MTITELRDKFVEFPKYMRNGAGKLAKRFNVDREDIYEAKEEAKQIISGNFTEKAKKAFKEAIEGYSEQQAYIISQTKDNVKIKSNKPLSPTEINELVGADGINTVVSRVWNKSAKNGTEWDYSIDLRYNIQDFYNQEELKEKLKELFPDTITEFIFTTPSLNPSSMSMVIYLSDDHLGMLLENGAYTKYTYQERLKLISNSAINQFYNLQELVIVSLGDQMNGWNEETTRGGHKVKSSSNKDQFDDFVSSRKIFYDDIFSSGIAANYKIVEVNNSNHCGLGFSYMANEWLKLYVSQKYPKVVIDNSVQMITQINLLTKHTLFAVHGKDEKHQKNPFPVVLDAKTENYFLDYILEQGVNPKQTNVSIIKADQHKYAETEGKSFRYVSVPSIADGSDWQKSNFGSSKAGVVIELFWPELAEPMRQVVRF